MKLTPKYELTMIDLINYMTNTGLDISLSMEGFDVLNIRVQKDVLTMIRKVGLLGLDEDAQADIIKYNLVVMARQMQEAENEIQRPVAGIDA